MDFEKQLPVIKELLLDRLLPEIKTKGVDIFKDDKKLKPLLGKLHGFLPLAVRLIMGEESFVKFCLTHKKKLFPSSAPKTTKKAPAKASTKPAANAKTSEPKSSGKSKTAVKTTSKKAAPKKK